MHQFLCSFSQNQQHVHVRTPQLPRSVDEYVDEEGELGTSSGDITLAEAESRERTSIY